MLFSTEDIASGRPEAELAASLKRGKTSVDGRHVRKDGTLFWCTDTVQPLHDEHGAITGFTKIVRDTNEHHLDVNRVRESEERLRLLIEGIADYGIISIDPDGSIQTWNAGAQKLFGYCEAEVLGKHFSLLYTPEALLAGMPAAELAAAAKNGQAVDEGLHVRRSGDLFYASGLTTRLKPDRGGRVRGFVKITHDTTATNEANEKIKERAFHDELTHLPNRAYFMDFLRRSIAHTKRHVEGRFAVIFLDLDRFKIINDSLGHVVGDQLLVHVARTLEDCVRPEDIVARLGGDEFTVLLPEINETVDATRVADRIQAALADSAHLEGVEVVTTASLGIAIGSSACGTAEEILRDADTAMYEAKARGRAGYVLFDNEIHARAVDLLTLQMDLRRAFAREEFFVEYQPIVSLENCRLVGFEALVRWHHPRRGVLLPADFIGEAENIGLIIQLDRWVLQQACRQIRVWQVQCHDPALTVSVNFSSKQFADEGLVDVIRDALRRNGLAAASLKLEITETVLMEKLASTAKTVLEVEKLGIELHVDDFGTGYSSLSYLTRLPLKLLKVDRTFVAQTVSNSRCVEMARTIVTLAHSLSLTALAEGIETQEQHERLRALGCEFAQGYYYSPPVNPEIAQRLIGHSLPRSGDSTSDLAV